MPQIRDSVVFVSGSRLATRFILYPFSDAGGLLGPLMSYKTPTPITMQQICLDWTDGVLSKPPRSFVTLMSDAHTTHPTLNTYWRVPKSQPPLSYALLQSLINPICFRALLMHLIGPRTWSNTRLRIHPRSSRVSDWDRSSRRSRRCSLTDLACCGCSGGFLARDRRTPCRHSFET